jgi:tRNA isopentenyl-2-thiomethyl-A-37 hydroxylase MiaE
MDACFVAANAIPTLRLPSPIPVFLADDSPSPAVWITEVTHPLMLMITDHHVEELWLDCHGFAGTTHP